LDAAANNMDLLPLAMAGTAAQGPAPRVAQAVREDAMAALDAQRDLRATPEGFSAEEMLAPYKVGDMPNVYYIPDWIAREEEADFTNIADGDMRAWEDMRTRSSQEWGAGDRCECGRGLRRMPLPPRLLEHFNTTSIKARFVQADIMFMYNILHHRIDSNHLVSLLGLNVPGRRSRHTGLFHEPFGRVNTVKNGLVARIPRTCNLFLQHHPSFDFFHSSASFRRDALEYGCSLNSYAG